MWQTRPMGIRVSLAVALLGSASACSLVAGEPDTGFAAPCTLGDRQACECDDGTAAFQHCIEGDSGVNAYGACECGGEPGTGEGEGESKPEAGEGEGEPDLGEGEGEPGGGEGEGEPEIGEGEGEGEPEGGEGEGEGEPEIGEGEGEGEPEGGEGEGEGEGEAVGPGSLGGDCYPNQTCNPDLICVDGLCTMDGHERGACLEGDVCVEGLACVEAVCRPAGERDQPCLPNAECAEGLRCDNDRCILAQGGQGEACFGNNTCLVPWVCNAELCRARGGEGDPCERDAHCADGLICPDETCELPAGFLNCLAGCGGVGIACGEDAGALCTAVCIEDAEELGCLADAVQGACSPEDVWRCTSGGCDAVCQWLDEEAEPEQGCDLGVEQCLLDCNVRGTDETRGNLFACTALAVADQCLLEALEECSQDECDGAAADCDPSNALFCLERRDFVRCERNGDFGYAACLDGTCVGIGCGALGCNSGRQHFRPAAGEQGRYVASDDGVVEDTETNLMWERATTEDLNLASADGRCPALQLGGYSDWRLPDIFELFSLADLGAQNGPAIDREAFPGTFSGWYWTTDGVHGDAAGLDRWRVDFDGGTIGRHNFPTHRAVRCVRGRPVFNRFAAGARFGSDPRGVILDRVTKLDWEHPAGGGEGRQTWSEARDRCRDLVIAEEDDWRLPTAHELFATVNTRAAAPANDDPFTDAQRLAFWSMTWVIGDPNAAYALAQSTGTLVPRDHNQGTTSRCVRSR